MFNFFFNSWFVNVAMFDCLLSFNIILTHYFMNSIAINHGHKGCSTRGIEKVLQQILKKLFMKFTKLFFYIVSIQFITLL